MNKEIWKPVVGHEGCYEVSNLGRIKSLSRAVHRRSRPMNIKERIIKPWDDGQRYPTIRIAEDGKRKNKKVHRLVAAAFLGNSKLHVDHIDRNPENNNLNNLRYCTGSQNMGNSNSKEGSSSYKGVTWNKGMNKWLAQIVKDYKYYYLGCFKLEEDAARAYDKKAIELFGEFSKTNLTQT